MSFEEWHSVRQGLLDHPVNLRMFCVVEIDNILMETLVDSRGFGLEFFEKMRWHSLAAAQKIDVLSPVSRSNLFQGPRRVPQTAVNLTLDLMRTC